jgi:CheY-like chemotaxis protein
LIVHEDIGVATLLRAVFERQGYEVRCATTLAMVAGVLDEGGIGAIILGWETALGRQTQSWVHEHHRELLHRCVFLVGEMPADAHTLICRPCRADDLGGLLDATSSIMSDHRGWRMLLVDDDPTLLGEMAVLLEQFDFDVVTVCGGKPAIELLRHAVFDVVLCDWMMPGVAGQQVHRWVAEHRPEMLHKLVFMTGGDLDAVRDGDVRPVAVPKGTDSPTLLGYLHQAVGSFARGTAPVDISNVRVVTPEPRSTAQRRHLQVAEPDDDIQIEIVLG